MKHDYKAALEIWTEEYPTPDNKNKYFWGEEIEAIRHALAMMQKLQQPSEGMKRVYATYKTTGIATRNEQDHPEILKAMLEQAEKEIEG